MAKDELQVCVSARQHGKMAPITETAPADAGNAFGSLTTTTTDMESSAMAEPKSTPSLCDLTRFRMSGGVTL